MTVNLDSLPCAPIGQHPRMQDILIDRGEFVLEDAIQEFDRLLIVAQGACAWRSLYSAAWSIS